ncbi:MAG TPA: histidinol-phosphatase [Rhizomicrobium sp.]|jgi:myo-inositol-1(or 4)-monophosphatase
MLDEETIAFAHRLADAAGGAIRPYFRARLEIIDKGNAAFDPVTQADRDAEGAMRALIRSERPDDGILGEEFGVEQGSNGCRWVLDPIDGTRAFITGRPTWGTLIALEEEGRRVLGIIDQPILRERFIAYGNVAEFHSPEGRSTLGTRACAMLASAAVSTTHPWGYFSPVERAGFEELCSRARMSYFGGDCYAYGLLAMGHIDLIVEASLAAWDVAALVPIVEKSGGVITDWSGNPVGQGGRIVASGDARVHAETLEVLSQFLG